MSEEQVEVEDSSVPPQTETEGVSLPSPTKTPPLAEQIMDEGSASQLPYESFAKTKYEKRQYTRFTNELFGLYGLDLLAHTTAKELEFTKDVYKFFRKRVEIEEQYAKSLSQLAQKAKSSTIYGSVNNCWEGVIAHTNSIATTHANLAAQITERVAERIGVLIKDMENQRKQLEKETSSMNSEFSKHVEAYKKTRDDFHKATRDAEIAFLTLEKAKTEGKDKDIKKLEKDLEKKRQTGTKEEEEYKQQIQAGNAFIDKYYDELMPSILSEYEHMETVRNHMLKSNIKKLTELMGDTVPDITKTVEALTEVVKQVHLETDFDQFVKRNRTGLKELRQHYEYEPYQPGQVKTRRTTALFSRGSLNPDKAKPGEQISPVQSPTPERKGHQRTPSVEEILAKPQDQETHP